MIKTCKVTNIDLFSQKSSLLPNPILKVRVLYDRVFSINAMYCMTECLVTVLNHKGMYVQQHALINMNFG